jgi:hypothetical protein
MVAHSALALVGLNHLRDYLLIGNHEVLKPSYRRNLDCVDAILCLVDVGGGVLAPHKVINSLATVDRQVDCVEAEQIATQTHVREAERQQRSKIIEAVNDNKCAAMILWLALEVFKDVLGHKLAEEGFLVAHGRPDLHHIANGHKMGR